MKYILTLLLITTGISFAQQEKEKCDCSVVFDDLVQKIENNYIYLAQLRIDDNVKEYDVRIKNYRKKAKITKSKDCTELLKGFVKYFKDGHLFVYEMPIYTTEEQQNFKATIKSNKPSITNILNTMEYQKGIIEKNELDGIIGKWTDGTSEFAIIKDEDYYRAYIINSAKEHLEEGELKAEFKKVKEGFEGVYISYDYQPRYIEGNLYKEATLLEIIGASVWVKIDESESREINTINHKEIKQPKIIKLDDKNTLFSIPSFSYDYDNFIKIILDNEEILKNTTNLIFDIRGNTGGSGLYTAFMDLFATRAIPSSQGKVLASKATLTYFERFAKNAPDVYGSVVKRIKENMGKIVDGPKYPEKVFKPNDSKVKNVAILTDKACGSASESFIIHSKQASTKVKTFGSPTRGMIDYTSVNVLKLNSGDQNIFFGYPTSTLTKEVIPVNGYNKTGILPDVQINKEVKDKVQFIVNYYNNN